MSGAAGEYPFGRAAGSFFLNGGERILSERAGADAPAPLIAYGANASPERLAGTLAGAPVAALAGRLRGWAVVHSAHVSPYGAVPATIVPEPGAVAEVHVLLLADHGPLDLTEPNYDRVRLDGLELEAEHLGPVTSALAYVSKWGPLLVGGMTVPVGTRPQSELLRLVAP